MTPRMNTILLAAIAIIVIAQLFITYFTLLPKTEYRFDDAIVRCSEPFTSGEPNSTLNLRRTLRHSYSKSNLKLFTRFVNESYTEVLLTVRKLVLWSVREVNRRIAGQECTKWWANPRSVIEMSEMHISNDVRQYILKFKIQPGQLSFETVVNVHSQQPPYDSDFLEFVSGRRMQPPPTDCGTVPHKFRHMCLCTDERMEAEVKTLRVRKLWGSKDPEIATWPPNSSFFVQDYFPFGRLAIYLKSPENDSAFCGPEIKMLILVSSKPTNFVDRVAIRNTFGNADFLKPLGVKLVFVFDKVQDKQIEEKVDDEFKKYNDIVQAPHDHSYHNLSLRAISMLNWLVTKCRENERSLPRWVMKTDDDYFVNVPLALQVAEANPDVEVIDEKFLKRSGLTKGKRGSNCCGQIPIRVANSTLQKFYTPRYMFTPRHYPNYISGAMWLIRGDVLSKLLKASLTTPLIHMEDVFVTGLLTRAIGVQPRDLAMVSYERSAGDCVSKLKINSEVNDTADFYVHWRYLHQETLENCTLLNGDKLKVLPIKTKFPGC